jgi:oligopeptide/dipeptide ABC transporter ATP-binding protein
MVFQDPYGSVAPTVTIEGTLNEPYLAHKMGDKKWRAERVDGLLDRVGLDRSFKHRFPSEMSGGQLQRVSIARALALEPKLLVLDEPVSALDVSTKADIINLLADLKASLGLTYLFISHDLSTLRVLTDRVAVMYLGEIIEEGPSDEIYDNPLHPYTKALLAAVPVPDPAVQRARVKVPVEGDIPSPLNAPPGCRFHNRCPDVMPQCREIVPQSVMIGATRVSCHLYISHAALSGADQV